MSRSANPALSWVARGRPGPDRDGWRWHRGRVDGPRQASPGRTWTDPALRTAARHYVEMVAAMFAGMALLEPLWPETTSVSLHAVIMATNMSLGMSALMLLRRHQLRSILTMSAAMYAPFIILLVPYQLGLLEHDAFYDVGHVAMLTLMALPAYRQYSRTRVTASSTDRPPPIPPLSATTSTTTSKDKEPHQ